MLLPLKTHFISYRCGTFCSFHRDCKSAGIGWLQTTKHPCFARFGSAFAIPVVRWKYEKKDVAAEWEMMAYKTQDTNEKFLCVVHYFELTLLIRLLATSEKLWATVFSFSHVQHTHYVGEHSIWTSLRCLQFL